MAFNTLYFLLLPFLFISCIQLQLAEGALNATMDNLYIYSEDMSGATSVMPENCTPAFEKFSKAMLNITNCYITYAAVLPIRVCMNCEESHTALVEAYQDLKNQNQSNCFNSDQLSILDIVYKNGNDLWQKRHCQNCYDHINETKWFFQSSNELATCMNTTNSTANSICIECHDAYANLSASYNRFVQFGGDTCIDIVDAMNMSRREWGNYCAVVFDYTIGYPDILTALTIGLTPLMFYVLAKNVSRLEDVKLVRPKRKITILTASPPDCD